MLYFIATPIGNLGDISYRAVETLKSVDIIACEDTRKSSILLNFYNIKKKLISYHKNNEFNSSKGIVELLKQGKNIAVISDAGMPVVSDPGNILAQKLREENLDYTVIPGASAGLSALVLSGFDARRFSFVGFLPEKNKDKARLLAEIKNYRSTLIFYISPHNLIKDINFLAEMLGGRNACLVKEITKLFENKYYFRLNEFDENYEIRGEFVLIVEGNSEEKCALKNLSYAEQIEFYIEKGLSKKDALKRVAKENKIKNIYNVLK